MQMINLTKRIHVPIPRNRLSILHTVFDMHNPISILIVLWITDNFNHNNNVKYDKLSNC